MNSELTIDDLNEVIIKQIESNMKSLYDEACQLENVNNIDDLKVWYENIEFTIKLLKKINY